MSDVNWTEINKFKILIRKHESKIDLLNNQLRNISLGIPIPETKEEILQNIIFEQMTLNLLREKLEELEKKDLTI